jgi:hypothetical protein
LDAKNSKPDTLTKPISKVEPKKNDVNDFLDADFDSKKKGTAAPIESPASHKKGGNDEGLMVDDFDDEDFEEDFATDLKRMERIHQEDDINT